MQIKESRVGMAFRNRGKKKKKRIITSFLMILAVVVLLGVTVRIWLETSGYGITSMNSQNMVSGPSYEVVADADIVVGSSDS